MSKSNKLTGIIAAPFTPMHKDGSINFENIERLKQHLQSSGVSAVLVNGTTGEGLSLTIKERMNVLEKWGSGNNDFKITVNVSNDSIEQAKELAAHAASQKVSAIFFHSTVFFRPANIEQLVSCCSDVANAVPNIPFYYYHIPSHTHVNFKMLDFLKVAGPEIKNFRGLKYTDIDIVDFFQCTDYNDGKYDILLGRDQAFLPALTMGANGFIGSTYNFMAPLFVKIKDNYIKGNVEAAQKDYSQAVDIMSILSEYGILAAGKVVMSMIGIDCGSMRKPCRQISKKEFEEIRSRLEKTGFKFS